MRREAAAAAAAVPFRKAAPIVAPPKLLCGAAALTDLRWPISFRFNLPREITICFYIRAIIEFSGGWISSHCAMRAGSSTTRSGERAWDWKPWKRRRAAEAEQIGAAKLERYWKCDSCRLGAKCCCRDRGSWWGNWGRKSRLLFSSWLFPVDPAILSCTRRWFSSTLENK